jgi:hypothetical protein
MELRLLEARLSSTLCRHRTLKRAVYGDSYSARRRERRELDISAIWPIPADSVVILLGELQQI